MFEQPVIDLVIYGWILVAVVTFVALRYRHAAYGRYAGESRAPQVPARLGWVVMESVSLLIFAALFLASARTAEPVAWAYVGLWELHYLNRTLVFPLRARITDKKMPSSILGLSIMFNVVNASLNGWWLFHAGPLPAASWLLDPRFLVGAGLFAVGMAVNVSADHQLAALRAGGETGYRVPMGGLYRWVSCPNYLGEILEWLGWAMATWSLAGLSFAVWTICNLAPRALAHHRWYRQQFADYPAARRALIPYLV